MTGSAFEVLFKVFMALGGVAGMVALFLAPYQRRKIGADTQKVDADRAKTNADREIAQSAEARAWAQQFVARTEAAERKAESAERKAERCAQRVDQLDEHIDRLEELLRSHHIRPPAKPAPPPVVFGIPERRDNPAGRESWADDGGTR